MVDFSVTIWLYFQLLYTLYKEVSNKDTKTDEQLLSGWKAKKERNSEIAREKTAEDIRTLLGREALPQSAFTKQEEAMIYYFMLPKLRSANYKAAGLGKDGHYRMSGEALMKQLAALTEEQKTVIRRDYLHSHLVDGTMTVSSAQGALMLAFAKLHLPEQTTKIENSYKDEYDRKNARLDERIVELEKRMKPAKTGATAAGQGKTDAPAPAKPEAKGIGQGGTAEVSKPADQVPVPSEVPAESLKMIPSKIDGKAA